MTKSDKLTISKVLFHMLKMRNERGSIGKGDATDDEINAVSKTSLMIFNH